AAITQGGVAGVGSLRAAWAALCRDTAIFRAVQAFVVSQVNGTWGKAKEVPGTAALNQGGFANFGSVSCASAGNCSAGGFYVDSSGGFQVFVVSQGNGSGGEGKEGAGAAGLNQDGEASIPSVFCGATGSLSAGVY